MGLLDESGNLKGLWSIGRLAVYGSYGPGPRVRKAYYELGEEHWRCEVELMNRLGSCEVQVRFDHTKLRRLTGFFNHILGLEHPLPVYLCRFQDLHVERFKFIYCKKQYVTEGSPKWSARVPPVEREWRQWFMVLREQIVASDPEHREKSGDVNCILPVELRTTQTAGGHLQINRRVIDRALC